MLKAKAIAENKYVSAVLPDTDNVQNIIGVTLLQHQKYQEAAQEFRAALQRREDSADANRNLGTALAAMGNVEEAITYLQRAVQLAPGNEFAKRNSKLPSAAVRSSNFSVLGCNFLLLTSYFFSGTFIVFIFAANSGSAVSAPPAAASTGMWYFAAYSSIAWFVPGR